MPAAVSGGAVPRLGEMTQADPSGLGREEHWDAAYRDRGVTGVSWFQPAPAVSLELLDALGVDAGTPVVDVGGGASLLVDRLVGKGFEDVSVLDVSEVALGRARRRLGSTATVTWVHDDVLRWRPDRRYGAWHDRALLHFLTDEEDRAAYRGVLRAALLPGAAVVVATFAEDGPGYCSGFPVARYGPSDLALTLGPGFEMLSTRREEHMTPDGVMQPFTWIAGRMA